jgi:hypothetical protein
MSKRIWTITDSMINAQTHAFENGSIGNIWQVSDSEWAASIDFTDGGIDHTPRNVSSENAAKAWCHAKSFQN